MPRPVCPPIAADVIIEIGAQIVLIERKNFPPGWAIPGGFVDLGESVEAAAVREMREETSLKVELTALMGIYSRPGRDPRGPTVSVVYVGRSSGVPKRTTTRRRSASLRPAVRPRRWPSITPRSSPIMSPTERAARFLRRESQPDPFRGEVARPPDM